MQQGYDLYGKTDARFIDSAFRLLRDEFRYFPSLNSTQFLSEHYWERKLNLVADILKLVLEKHEETLWLKRQQDAVWTKPKVYVLSYMHMRSGGWDRWLFTVWMHPTRSKAGAARVENHVLPPQITNHAASVLQLLQNSRRTRRKRYETAESSASTPSSDVNVHRDDRPDTTTFMHQPNEGGDADGWGEHPFLERSNTRRSHIHENRNVSRHVAIAIGIT